MKKDNELNRMRLRVDEMGLSRVLATLNVGKILVPALAELLKNVNTAVHEGRKESMKKIADWSLTGGNLVYREDGDIAAIPVTSASHYIEILSGILQGKPILEENLDEISLLFLNKGVNIVIFDDGQQLQKGEIDVPVNMIQGHLNWVCLSFKDNAFKAMASRFFANQIRMDHHVDSQEKSILDDPASLGRLELISDDLQPVIGENVNTHAEMSYSEATPADLQDAETSDVYALTEDDFQKCNWKRFNTVLTSSGYSFSMKIIHEGIVKVVQLWQHFRSSGVSVVPVYDGVAYSASAGNAFFYQAMNAEKELGMVKFDTSEGRKVYQTFLKTIEGVLTDIDRKIEEKMAIDDLGDTVDYCRSRLHELFGNFDWKLYLLIPELKKIPGFEIPNVIQSLKLLGWTGSQDSKVNGVVLKNTKGKGTILVDNRFYTYRFNSNTYEFIITKDKPPYPPDVPPFEIDKNIFNSKERAYLIKLDRRLYEFVRKNPSLDVYTVKKENGSEVDFLSDESGSSSGDVGILVPDDVVVRGSGTGLVIFPRNNLLERLETQHLGGLPDLDSKIYLTRSEEDFAKVINLDDVARRDVIAFRGGKPYRVPFNRMKEYGIRTVTDRLDVAFLYEDRGFIDPLFSIRMKENGIYFPRDSDSKFISEVEAYDGMFLWNGEELVYDD